MSQTNTMLIQQTNHLAVQIVTKMKIAVFTWRGFPTSDEYHEGTNQSLEVLRDHRNIHSIILNATDIRILTQKDVEMSVKSTVDYLGIARGNYRMAVVLPKDEQAKKSIHFYIESLNKTLKKRFIARPHVSVKTAMIWLSPRKLF